MKSWKAFLIIAIVLLVPLALAIAQNKGGPKYDRSTEVKIKGTIEVITEASSPVEKATHLTIRTDTGIVEVCVCPAKFLSEMEVTFAKGDRVEIVGSKTKTPEAKDIVLAREITKGNSTLTVRDKEGNPAWTWKKG